MSAGAAVIERANALAAALAVPVTDGRELVDALARLGEVRRFVDAVGADLAGQIERLSSFECEKPLAAALGSRNASVLVETEAGLTADEARRWCRVGAAVQPETNLQGEALPPRHEVLGEALAAGRIGIDSADRVLSTLGEAERLVTREQLAELEALLVSSAPTLGDRRFARLCRAAIARLDPDGVEPREDLLRERSGVTVHHTRDGLTRLVATMHPEAAGFLIAAIDARTAPRRQPAFRDTDAVEERPADVRSLRQQRLDALVTMARESLGSDHGRVAGTSVTMSVTVSLDALRTGLGEARIAGIDEPISASTARRLAADAEIIPVVLGGPSEPLDLGCSVRLASEPQRRALGIRDGGCIWSGCMAPPGWCEVAHLEPWALGGATDLSNMALMCAFHHRRFDRDGWRLEERDGARYLIPPPWVDSAQTPRPVQTGDLVGAA